MCSPRKLPRRLPRPRPRAAFAAYAALLAGLATFAASANSATPPASATPASPPGATPPSVVQRPVIEHAVAELRKDPNLGHVTTQRRLRWNEAPNPQNKPATDPSTANWLLRFFDFVTATARVGVWVFGAIIAACTAIWIWRLIRTRQLDRRITPARVATHVEGLDIRPASLPKDIGAAALALLGEGNTRAALALLYRGSLSRAVHRFAVGIGESFTESEALRAIQAQLDAPRSEYFAALVATWQRTVYGALTPPQDTLVGLCRNFAAAFDTGAA